MAHIFAKNRLGRILLHLVCLAHDGKWRWHSAGISRELQRRSNHYHAF